MLEKGQRITYIAMDMRLSELENFKGILEMNEKSPDIIFLCGKPEYAPIPKESCDYFCACYGLQTYILEFGCFPYPILRDFLKTGGKWFETILCTDQHKNIVDGLEGVKDFFCCSTLKDQLNGMTQNHFVETSQCDAVGEVEFYFNPATLVRFFSYVGIK